jgi:ATP-dependent helicase/nuclease subunit B
MPNPAPRVFTIPASTPFLPALIAALVEGRLVPGFAPGRDPMALASATLYLPTQRACRLARDLFLDGLATDAAILPRIVPLGDIDEDEIVFSEAATGDLAATALALPQALGGLERRLLLAELVRKWASAISPTEKGHAPLVANSPAAALALADDLARLMDDMIMRGVAWDSLDGLVPDHLDRYWQLTLQFLRIARETWPAVLAERGMIEPAARRDALIRAETQRLTQAGGPVIAAGSTGSIPTTAALIAAVAQLPQGAVVLPGLDTDLDDASWKMIAGGDDLAPAAVHPQFALQNLLARIGLDRSAVQELAAPQPYGREKLVSEAFRPAASTDLWHRRLEAPGFAAQAAQGFEHVALIEAANAEEEALAIAVALREAAEKNDGDAALITPNRALARRVLAALERWNVPVDDSGGDRLSDMSAGVFARLAAEAALGGLPPVTLLALLKHPLLRLGAPAQTHARAIATLERAVLRGPRPKSGSLGLLRALEHFRAEHGKALRKEESELYHADPRAKIADADLAAAGEFAQRLAAALAPLENLKGAQGFAELAARHRAVVAALADDGAQGAFGGPDGAALVAAFDDIAAAAPGTAFRVELDDYADLFRIAVADRVVRRPELPGVRVRIYGPLEARLQNLSRVVLGGLVEGVWPPEARSDPWLNRPMRQQLGLDLPERRIGLSAHDFVQALGAKDVILTRSAKLAGAPTVASRFVQRLAAVAGARWQGVRANGDCYLAWARALDSPLEKPQAAKRPAPTPPFAARPRRLSVTEIEHWLRDPYTTYAKHVLKLIPLDDIDMPPGAADRGTVIHNSIGEFAKKYPKAMPDDPVGALREIGERHFKPLEDFPEARAFWWPRYLRIAEWFARFEIARRAKLSTFDAEIGGSIGIPFGGEEFKLTVRADRIERLIDGRYAILDYKTGAPPSEPQVRTGLSPQLTLEAAILRQGGFKTIPAGASVADLLYVRLSGGAVPGEEKLIKFKEGTPDEHADHALARLKGLIAKFADPAIPYYSLLHPMWTTHYGTYDHLARVQEWSLTGGAAEDGGGE